MAIDALKSSLHDNKLMIDAIRLLINLSLVVSICSINYSQFDELLYLALLFFISLRVFLSLLENA